MIKKDAENYISKLKRELEENGIWYEETRENRPKLGKINITISIKIEPEK